MKSKLIFFTLCTILFFSCKKDNEINLDSDCFKTYFEMHNLVPYTGQSHECKERVVLYEYKNRFFFNRRTFCDRSDGLYESCDGIIVNDSNSPIDYFDFIENAERGEIIGIEDN